jgi:hypothetical protein
MQAAWKHADRCATGLHPQPSDLRMICEQAYSSLGRRTPGLDSDNRGNEMISAQKNPGKVGGIDDDDRSIATAR